MKLRRTALAAICAAASLQGQKDWPTYGHDPGGMRYSPLTQIDVNNVSKLHRAWTYHTGDTGNQFETTPIVVGNRMYLSTQTGRIVALEPETGKEIWTYNPNIRRPREHRGVAYWPGDAATPARILFGTSDSRLIALDAASGKPVSAFGKNGEVDLRAGVADDFARAGYSVTSPPAIYKDLVIVGGSTQEGPSRGPSGDPRAFSVRTGKLVWRFHTVPQPGEPGNETWGPDGWKQRAGPSLWGLINVDTARGLVLLSTGNPADSWYGGDRKGTNLYANCVLALEAETGKLRWYYQIVHHDVFDYDVTGGPALIEVTRGGRKIPAVAQITKMGLLFLLDEATGKPLFGVEERPVPKGGLPGDELWPTQPFPIKPLPLASLSITREQLSRRTPEAARYCAEQFDKVRNGGIYTPYGSQTTLVFPGAMGGGNWGSVAFDPRLGYVFVNISNLGIIGHLVPTEPGSAGPYRNETGYLRFVDQEHYPCQQPPWGELAAVNASTGEIAWKVPLGNYDELSSQGLTNTGTPNVGGAIATASGLIFIGATNDSRLRAFSSKTGEVLWSGRLDATANATPITYLGRDGQQYLVVAAGGPAHLRNVADNSPAEADSVIAYSLTGRAAEPVPVTSKAAPVGQPQAAAAFPDGAGKAEVMRICTACHGTGTFSQSRLTREQWRSEVDSMVGRGAKGTDSEIRLVVDYLARNLGVAPKSPGR
ncbi:MAG: PQQ-binding-like beta-propeller repeat protein [Terriglobia bacterium]